MMRDKRHGAESGVYGAFGMRIASEIALPELRAAGGEADAQLKVVRTSTSLEQGDPWWTLSADDVLDLRLEKLQVRVSAGVDVDIRAADELPNHEIRVWLLGRAVSALLLQRGYLLVHANAMATGDGEAAAFYGQSGDGKSTLAAALMVAGLEPLCDDLLAIRFDAGGHAWVAPGIPRIKIGPKAAAMLGIDIADAPPVGAGTDKVQLRLALDERWDREYRLTRLYRLERGPLEITPLIGQRAGAALLDNLYWPELQERMAGQSERFVAAMRLADQCDCFSYRRPFDLDRLIESRGALLDHLGISR